MPREVAYPEVVSMRCIGCMTCVEQCPLVAIEVVERLPAAI
jgi:formate hydrogenlyase subunit 6/NADH:ubiquinone oxidoreductase subunit I